MSGGIYGRPHLISRAAKAFVEKLIAITNSDMKTLFACLNSMVIQKKFSKISAIRYCAFTDKLYTAAAIKKPEKTVACEKQGIMPKSDAFCIFQSRNGAYQF